MVTREKIKFIIMDIDFMKCYKAKIKYQSFDLKEGALPDGTIAHFMTSFRLHEDESYPGDWAMMPAEGNFWIPSREIEIIEEITYEQYKRIEDELKPRNMTLEKKPWYVYSKPTN
jgi:hypothetical protein